MKKYYRKPHRYNKKKSIFNKKFSFLGFLVLIVVGAAFYGLFFWKTLWVEKITISGEQKITKEEISFLVEKNLENNILFLKTKSILKIDAERIKTDILTAFPQIATAEVRKSFFDAINVEVIERTAVGLWCDEGCFLIDKHGVIFEEVSTGSDLIVIETNELPDEVFLGQTIIPAGKIDQILKIQSELAEVPNISIKKAILVSNERLNIEMSDGWMAYFNLKGDLDWQVIELKLALEKQISQEMRKNLEYIDLRFSRVYYK